MIVQIGETAGKIWQLLDIQGELTLTRIKSEVKAEDLILHAALGWLAREKKIKIVKSGRSLTISLR